MQKPPEQSGKVLVVGFGNRLLGDLGVGVRAVELLCGVYALADNVEVVSADSADFDLLDALEDASYVIAVDHVYAIEEPGTIFRSPLQEFERPGDIPESAHEEELLSSLGVMEMTGVRPRGVLLAVQVGDTAPGTELSPVLETRLPVVVEHIARELAAVGLQPTLARDGGGNGTYRS